MATMTRTEVRQKLRNHDIDFQYADLSDLDLSDLDMRNISGHRAKFSGCNCEYTLFNGADLSFADFTGTNLHFASFRFADLEDAQFDRAILYGASFSQADLTGADFVGAYGIPTGDHTLIGSLLMANAGKDTIKRAIASMVMVNYDYCWASFAQMFLDNPMFSSPNIHEWVTQTFRPYPTLAGKLADTLAWAERMKQRAAVREAQERYEGYERE